MLWRAMWFARWTWPLVETLKTGPVFGGSALDAVGRVAPRCQVVSWVVGVLLPKWRPFFEVCDPWRDLVGDDRKRFVNPALVHEALLQGGLLAMAERFPTPEEGVAERAVKELPEIGLAGADRGMAALADHLDRVAAGMKAEAAVSRRAVKAARR